MGAALEKLLMPAEGSYTQEWTGFPEAIPDSLLVIPSVHLQVANEELVRSFFTQALQADVSKGPQEDGKSQTVRVALGPTDLIMTQQDGSCEKVPGWPGQLYVWVENIQQAWRACQDMEKATNQSIIEEAICNADERKADALILKLPSTETLIVVNQAPKGYPAKLQRNGPRHNLVCVVDVELCVPVGAVSKLMSFYLEMLRSAVKKVDPGKAMVMFASGDNIRQSLTFKEDEASSSWVGGCRLVIQMNSMPKFNLVESKLKKAGLLKDEATAALPSGESTELLIHEIIDPKSEEVILQMEHVIRAPPS